MTLPVDCMGSPGPRTESQTQKKVGPFFGRVYLALRSAEDAVYPLIGGLEGQVFFQSLHLVTALAEEVTRRETEIGSHTWYRSTKVASWVFEPLSQFVRSIEAQLQHRSCRTSLDDRVSASTPVAPAAKGFFKAAAPLGSTNTIGTSRPATGLLASPTSGRQQHSMSNKAKDAQLVAESSKYWLDELRAGLTLVLLCEKYGFWLVARHSDLRIRLADKDDKSAFQERDLFEKNTFLHIEACAALLEFESSTAIPARHSCPPNAVRSGHASSQDSKAAESALAVASTSETATASASAAVSTSATTARQTTISTSMSKTATRLVQPQAHPRSSYCSCTRSNSSISCSQGTARGSRSSNSHGCGKATFRQPFLTRLSTGDPDQTPAATSGTAHARYSANGQASRTEADSQSFPTLHGGGSGDSDPSCTNWCLLGSESPDASPTGTVTPTPSEQEMIIASSFSKGASWPQPAPFNPASGHDSATVADVIPTSASTRNAPQPFAIAATQQAHACLPDEPPPWLHKQMREQPSGDVASKARPQRSRVAVKRSGHTHPPSGLCDQRWWAPLTDRCPVSHVEVSSLPYPPFKLLLKQQLLPNPPTSTAQVRGGRGIENSSPTSPPLRPKSGHVLIDGQFFAAQVLAHWDFTVLGQPLTEGFVTALDKYLKRCKVSAFRLAPALALAQKGTDSAQQEITSLRAKAAQRLQRLLQAQERRRQMPTS